MLHLIFRAGQDFYAIQASRVDAVVPCATWKSVPGGPDAVAGIFNYRGEPVVVVDSGVVLAGVATPLRVSTRIALCRVKRDGGGERCLGLLGAEMVRVERISPDAFRSPGAKSPDVPCAGEVAAIGPEWVQEIRPEDVINADVIDALLAAEAIGT